MPKYIELIDKYRIEQRNDLSEYGGDMNPPNYIWTDNTGEIVRCEKCKHWQNKRICQYFSRFRVVQTNADDYCSKGEKKDDNGRSN